jgi:hypothetical protein
MSKEINSFAIEVTRNSLDFLGNMTFTVIGDSPWDHEQFVRDQETFTRMYDLLERYEKYNEENN